MKKRLLRRGSSLSLAVLAWAGYAHADTPAIWSTAVSGNWTDGTKWSTTPNYPNNGSPSGTNYNASIAAAGSAYTVSLGQNITIDGLTLNSSAATLQQTSGVMAVDGVLDLKAGTYQLAGGNLTNAVVQSEGGALQISGQTSTPTLDNVTLATSVTLATALTFQNGLTLSNSVLTLGGSGQGTPGQLSMNGSSTLGGHGTVILNGGSSNLLGQSPGGGYTFSIGSGVTIATGTGGGTIGPANGNLVNQGVIQINNSTTVVITGSWTNQGTINQSSGILNLAGTFSTADLGNFIHTGGQVQLGGVLNNNGHTFDLSTTGSLFSTGSTINGGIISSSSGANFNYGNGATWNGVALGSDLTITNPAAGNFASSALNLNGHTLTIPTGTNWSVTSPITGAGTVSVAASPSLTGASLTINGNGTGDTINPGVTVQSAGPNAPIILNGINGGTLMANNLKSSVTMQGSWSNPGTIALSNDGTLNLSGNFYPSAIGTITRADGAADTVIISGTVNNAGTTLNLDQTGSVQLQGCAINGGTITTSTGATMNASSYQSTFTGVTLGANLTVNAGVQISNGMTLNNATITIESQSGAGGSLNFTTGGTLGGTGTILLDGSGGNGAAAVETNGQVTVGPGILVTTTPQGAGRFGTAAIIFQGTVQPAAGGSITLDSMAMTGNVNIPSGTTVTLTNANNSGTILNNGTLNLGGTVNLAMLGNLTNNGQINIVGSLNNSGSTFTTNAAQLPWGLGTGGQISGGTIASPLTVFGSASLNNLTIASTITVQPSAALTIPPSLNFSNGMLDVQGAPSTQTATSLKLGDIFETGAITGTGVIKIDGGVNTALSMQTNWTLGPGIQLVVTGGATLPSYFVSGIGGNMLVNDGAITATSNAGVLAISAWNFGNVGTVSSTAAGTVNITSSNWNNSGTISTVGGTLGLTAPWINTGTISASTGGTINVSGSILPALLNQFQFAGSNWVNILGTLNNSGNTLSATAIGASLAVVGGTINGGTVANALSINNATLNGVTLDASAILTLNGPLMLKGITSNAGAISGTGMPISIGQANVSTGIFTNTGSINDPGGAISILAGAFNSSGPVLAGNISNAGTMNQLGSTMQLGTITGAGSLNVSSGAALIARSISQKSLSDSGAATLSARPAGQTAASTLSVVGSLSLTTTGLLDLNNNDLIVHSANAGAILAALQAGNANNTWTGQTGIRSTAAAGSPLYTLGAVFNSNSTGGAIVSTFDGATAVAGDMLIKFTYYGDANLDGKVDGSDYSRIDAAYAADVANPSSYTGWFNGDFNYDGVIDGSDYTLIDNAFDTQGSQLMAAVSAAQIPASSPVPEPATSAIICLTTAFAALGRRRHRST